MSAIDTLRTALFGNPPDPAHEPSREGVLAAFTELNNSVSALGVGLIPYETVALMEADVTQPEGTLGYVYFNNGDADDPANTVYQWRNDDWEVADWFFNIVAILTEQVIDEQLRSVIDFSNPVDGVTVTGGPVATPNTRYDSTVDSNGYLQITSTFASTYMFGWRSNIGRVAGRTYRAIVSFSATNYSAGSTAFGIAFDMARQTGVDAALSADNIWFVPRNGFVLVEQFSSGGAVTNPTEYTVTPNTTTTFVQTDVMQADLTENADGSATLRIYKNNTLASTHAINKLPAGVFSAGVRLTNGGIASIRLMQAPDSLVTEENIAEVNIGAGNAIIPTQSVGMARALPMSSTIDSAGLTTGRRVVPTGLPSYIPLKPVIVRSVGDVTLSNTAIGAFLTRFPEVGVGSVAFVSPTGNNGTGALNNDSQPYATISYALQSTAARIIVVENGEYTGFRYDYTHSSAQPKLIIARNRGLASIVNAGDLLSAATFTDSGGGIWKTTLVSADIYDVLRVVLTTTFDDFSFPVRLPWFTYIAGEAALRAAGTGFSFNTSTKELFIGLGGTSVESVKATLRAFYSLASQNNLARCLIYGSKLAIDGVNFYGITLEGLNYNDGGTQRVPEIFLSNLVSFCSSSYASNLNAGGLLVAENLRIHAAASDCFNQNWGSSGAEALMNICGTYGTMCGDTDTFGTLITQNRQFMSAHAGYAVGIGNVFSDNWGDEILDTSVNNAPSISWYIACMAAGRHPDLATGSAFAFNSSSYGAPYDRVAYLDTCAAVGGYTPNVVTIAGGASAKAFNCDFNGTISGSLPAYTPDAP